MARSDGFVRNVVAEFLQSGNKISNIEPQKHESPVEKIINREYTDDEQKISDILTEYVSPAVENDGGKISFRIRCRTQNCKNASTRRL
jgi:hypothetical protein